LITATVLVFAASTAKTRLVNPLERTATVPVLGVSQSQNCWLTSQWKSQQMLLRTALTLNESHGEWTPRLSASTVLCDTVASWMHHLSVWGHPHGYIYIMLVASVWIE
jgi:hypothetical protein